VPGLIWFGLFIILVVTASCGYLIYHDVVVERDADKERQTEIAPDRKVPHALEARKVAIIIDDIGYDPSPVAKILTLDAPVTLAILPHCPYSFESAMKAHNAGKEVMLHLPMEPCNYPEKNPGDGALLTDMSAADICRQLERNLTSVPYARGVNNHMGSKFMQDEEKLEVVFRKLQRNNLFFIDSYTTNGTKGKQIAGRLGLKFAGRDVFIDNNSNFTDTLAIFQTMIDKRNNWHTLIFIGHPYESTVRALTKAIPMLRTHNIDIVTVSELAE